MAQPSSLLVASTAYNFITLPYTSSNGLTPSSFADSLLTSEDPLFTPVNSTWRQSGYLSNFQQFSRTPTVTVTATDPVNGGERVFTFDSYGVLAFASEDSVTVATGAQVTLVVREMDLSGATITASKSEVSLSYTTDLQRGPTTTPCVALVNGQTQFTVTLSQATVVQFRASFCDASLVDAPFYLFNGVPKMYSGLYLVGSVPGTPAPAVAAATTSAAVSTAAAASTTTSAAVASSAAAASTTAVVSVTAAGGSAQSATTAGVTAANAVTSTAATAAAATTTASTATSSAAVRWAAPAVALAGALLALAL